MVSIEQKLEMKHHKALLGVTLLAVLIIGVFFGALLSATPEAPVLSIVTFAIVLLLFVVSLIMVSIVFRTRDELHALHEQSQQRLQTVHEGIKAARLSAPKK